MAKAPAFQFYAQDFLTGVMYLTNEEIGIYIKMLAKQWTDGQIPKKRLRFLVGFDWDNLSEELKSKFKDYGEYVANTRLEDEREKQINRSQTSRENGKLGGRPPKNKNLKKPKDNPEETSSYEDEDRSKKIEDEKEDRKQKTEIEKKGKPDFQNVVDAFNEICENLPSVQKLTSKRRTAIKNRIQEYKPEDVEVFFESVFKLVSESKFLTGENSRGWKADFDWIMKPSNFIKIIEKNYTNGKAKQSNNQGSNYSDEWLRKKAESLTGVQSE